MIVIILVLFQKYLFYDKYIYSAIVPLCEDYNLFNFCEIDNYLPAKDVNKESLISALLKFHNVTKNQKWFRLDLIILLFIIF